MPENVSLQKSNKWLRKIHGTCAFLTLVEKMNRLYVKNSINQDISQMGLHFDSTKPAPPISSKDPCATRYCFMNHYSFNFLQHLKWPKDILLFLKTDEEAMKILKVLFPNPGLVRAEGRVLQNGQIFSLDLILGLESFF